MHATSRKLLIATASASLLAAAPAAAQQASTKPSVSTPTASTPPSTTATTAAGSGGGASTTASTAAVAGSADDPQLYTCGKAKGMITPTFKPETELKDLITWAMGFTCKNFAYDSSILGRSKKVTIISPNKMSASDAYKLFLNALSTMGVTVVPKGNVLRIVETGTAKGETVRIVRKGTPSDSEEMIRFLFHPSYVTADTMNQALSVVKSKDGVINVVGNALIVTDYSSSIRDMMTLSRELDKPAAQDGIYTIRVEHADAKDLQAKLSEILGVGAAAGAAPAAAAPAPRRGKKAAAADAETPSATAGGGDGGSDDIGNAVPSKILVDERTNTLIVVASEAGYLRVRGLAKRLDVAVGAESAGSIHVYSLENANAEEMATTLNAALGNGGAAAQAGGGRRQGNQAAAPTAAPRQAAAVAEGLGASLEGQVRVTADAPTNSLVVVATGRDFMAVRDVIRKLDVARRQVYIEAVILEVKLNNEIKLGVSSHGGLPVGDGDSGLVLGGVQMPGDGLSSINPGGLLGAEGLIGGLIGAPIAGIDTLFGSGATSVTIPSYGMLFQAPGHQRQRQHPVVAHDHGARQRGVADLGRRELPVQGLRDRPGRRRGGRPAGPGQQHPAREAVARHEDHARTSAPTTWCGWSST
jgi:general secretion pathway protein D